MQRTSSEDLATPWTVSTPNLHVMLSAANPLPVTITVTPPVKGPTSGYTASIFTS